MTGKYKWYCNHNFCKANFRAVYMTGKKWYEPVKSVTVPTIFERDARAVLGSYPKQHEYFFHKMWVP